jgi:hypothetical protein
MKKIKLTLGLVLAGLLAYLIVWKPKNSLEKVTEKRGFATKDEIN